MKKTNPWAVATILMLILVGILGSIAYEDRVQDLDGVKVRPSTLENLYGIYNGQDFRFCSFESERCIIVSTDKPN